MAKAYQVKVLNGAMDVRCVDGKDRLVLRGVIDPGSVLDIQIGDYQREAGSLSDLSKLISAMKRGEQIPDVEIGVRGDEVREREGVFYIHSSCFVVDGLQRLTAVKRVLAEVGMDAPVHLGALFHIDTDEEWERNRFKILNLYRRRVSPNVILRNEKDSLAVQALYAMCADGRDFVLRGRVSWGQKMGRGELVPAFGLLKVAGQLHGHFGPGLSTSLEQLISAVDKTYAKMGPNIWRANIRAFFEAVDHAFGLRTIAYRDLSPQIKGGFLRTVARVIGDHQNFWEVNRLKVKQVDLAKLRQFPIRDPGVVELASSSSAVNDLLYAKLVQHLNSGRRTGKLLKWDGAQADGILIDCRPMREDEGDEEFEDSTTSESAVA